MAKRKAEDVDRGLEALALAAGNAMEASRETGIPERTLNEWRRVTHRERYERLREAHEESVDRELGEDLLNVVRRRVQAAEKTLNHYETALEKKDYGALKALSIADKNLLIGSGIANENSRLIRDKPTEIAEKRYDLPLIEALIREREQVIEGTAEELPAELDPGTTETAT